jgi:hypothetical protein
MAIIRFDTNVPQDVALKFADGKEVDGQYGSQVMFTLAGDDRIFVPPIVADKIREAGIQKMELFRICKKEVRDGNKKGIRWEVTRLSDAAEPEPAPQPQTPFDAMPTDLERKLQASIDQATQQKAQRAFASRPPAAPTQQSTETLVNNAPQQSNGNALDAVGHTGLSQLLAGCMVAAIDAAVLARDYAHAKGLTVALTEESIQDLTSTLMIHVQKMAELECRYDVKAAVVLQKMQANGGGAWRQ